MLGGNKATGINSRSTSVTYGTDSVKVTKTAAQVHMYLLGLGVEALRHFYKKVVLFAAVDLLTGVGKGQVENHYFLGPESNTSNHRLSGSTKGADYQRTQVRLLPSIGAKLDFSRLSFGTELSSVDLKFFSEKVEGSPAYSNLSFNLLDGHSFKLFLNYRF